MMNDDVTIIIKYLGYQLLLTLLCWTKKNVVYPVKKDF